MHAKCSIFSPEGSGRRLCELFVGLAFRLVLELVRPSVDKRFAL